jgi:ABC-type amino acid transport substrate-binding protein
MRASPIGRRATGWLVLLFASIAAPASPDLAELRERGSLRALVTSEEYVEWFALKDSESPGFERELLKDFARVNRLSLEVVVLEDFDALIPALLADKGDVIPSLNDTPARRDKVAFTVEVLPMHHVAVSRKPQTPPRTLDELKGRKVAVVSGTTWEQVTRAHVPAGQIVGFERTDQLMGALRAGTVSAAVMAVSEYIWQRQRDPDLEAGVLVGHRLSAAWGLRPQDRELREALDEFLRLKKQSASWSRLVVKYFGADALAILDRAGDGMVQK